MTFRKDIKKIVIRMMVILVFLPLFNAVYVRYFWKDDLAAEADMLLDLMALQDSCEILYFGESSNFSYNAEKDSMPDRISDFIGYHFEGIRLGTINSSAYHAGIYLPLIKQISTQSKVQTIVITLNMRTFDQAAIHSELESALQKKAVMYEPRPPLLNRVLISLNYYDDTPLKDRDLQMWKEWTYDTLKSSEVAFPYQTIKSWCAVEKFPLSEGGEDMKKRELADHYIKAYAFQIDPEKNPRIKDFDAIMKVAKKKNLKVVLNLMAENTAYADSLVGENLVWLMRSNRDLLVQRYTQMGAIVVDNLEVVPGWDYTDQNWTTEHYGQYGRQIIAANVAKAMKPIYPTSYRPKDIYGKINP
jgi:hypothetical protein